MFIAFSVSFYACEDSAISDYADNLIAEKYISSLCEGLSDFSSRLEASEENENIKDEISSFVTFLESLTPPLVLNEWHDDYIVLLRRIVDDPDSSKSSRMLFEISEASAYFNLNVFNLPLRQIRSS